MKDYLEALNAYLDNAKGTTVNRSDLITAWNTAVSAYEADEDVIQALADYSSARTAFANAFKNCVKMQSEIDGLGFKCQNLNYYAIPDVNNDFHATSQFEDAEGMKTTKRGESTFVLIRRAFENEIADGSCTPLCPSEI